VKLYYLLKNT